MKKVNWKKIAKWAVIIITALSAGNELKPLDVAKDIVNNISVNDTIIYKSKQ